MAYTRALSYFSAAAYCQDATAGIACYRVIADYEEHFEEKKQQLMEKLSSLVKTIFTAERMLVSATCEESEIPAVTQASAALKNVLYVPDQPGKNRSVPSIRWQKRTRDLWMHPRCSMWRVPEIMPHTAFPITGRSAS